MLKLIDEIINVSSKFIQQILYLESHGRTVDFLKIKSNLKIRRKSNALKDEIRDIIESILNIDKNWETTPNIKAKKNKGI